VLQRSGVKCRGALWGWLALCLTGGIGAAAGQDTRSAPALKPPAIRAAAAIAIDAQTGKTLFAKNPDKRLPPASTTKILTALLLAQRVPPKQPITTSPAAAATPGSRLGMKPGETYTARDLLYAMLLVSANDASVAAAEQAGGTLPKFVAQMNAAAPKLGAAHSHFVNPHGLHNPRHLSTARDLAALARKAMQNPAFAAAARARTYQVPRANGQLPTRLTNKNDLLWTFPGADGVKTGWTRAAGFCFVGSAARGGRRVITVVLNSPNWQAETAALLRYGFARLLPEAGRIAAARAGTDRAAHGWQLPGFPAPSEAAAPPEEAPASFARSQSPPDEDVPDKGESAAPALPPQARTGVPTGGAKPPTGRTPVPGRAAASPGMDSTRLPQAGKKPTPAGTFQPPAGSSPLKSALPPEAEGKRRPSHAGNGWLRTGGRAPAPARRNRLWRLLLLLLLLLAWRLLRYLRAGRFAMNPSLFDLSKLLGGPARRRKDSEAPQSSAMVSAPPESVGPTWEAKPPFTYIAPVIARRSGREWLESVLETPRLMEPVVRRQARALFDSEPQAYREKVLPLLSASNPKVRVVAASLLASSAPRQAEETLLAVLDEAQTPADVQADAIEQLAAHGGDRHEKRFVQKLLRDGSLPAARALAMLPALSEETRLTLQRALNIPAPSDRDAAASLRENLLSAEIACILAAQGALPPEDAQPLLKRLPDNHRDQVVVSVLQGVGSPWAVERLVETALHGHAYPALQALLDSDPAAVRATLAAQQDGLDATGKTRAIILKWLLMGEGEEAQVRQLAEAGDSLASGALNLARAHRYDFSQVPPDALLAAAQIFSLRLGYSVYPQEQVAALLHAAATESADPALSAQMPELEPMAQVYTRPEVYDAVQVALHAEDGLSLLLAGLARQPENRQYQQELAFWSDKTLTPTRLFLTHALCAGDSPAARAAVAARAADPCPMVRAAALRSLHARPFIAETPPGEMPLAA